MINVLRVCDDAAYALDCALRCAHRFERFRKGSTDWPPEDFTDVVEAREDHIELFRRRLEELTQADVFIAPLGPGADAPLWDVTIRW